MNLSVQQADQIEHLLNNIGREIKEIRQILAVAREENTDVKCTWLIGGECWCDMPDSKHNCSPLTCTRKADKDNLYKTNITSIDDIVEW